MAMNDVTVKKNIVFIYSENETSQSQALNEFEVALVAMKSLLLILAALSSLLLDCRGFSGQPGASFLVRGVKPSSTAISMTVLSYNGKKKDFPAGSSLGKAIAQLGVKVKYSCKKGDCATCQITLAGRYTKPCVAKVPPAPTLKSLQEKGLEIRA
jgi:hypothetical protein